jgi:hypothetical protein
VLDAARQLGVTDFWDVHGPATHST